MFCLTAPVILSGLSAIATHPEAVLAMSGWMAGGLGIWLHAKLPAADLDDDMAMVLARIVM